MCVRQWGPVHMRKAAVAVCDTREDMNILTRRVLTFMIGIENENSFFRVWKYK